MAGTSRRVMNTNRCAPVGEYAFTELMTRVPGRGHRDNPIEPAVEVVKILREGGVLQGLSPSPDRDGSQQQPPERSAERRITIFDGIFRVTQQMRQTNLPLDAVAALTAQHVEDPDLRPDLAEQRGYGRRATARFDGSGAIYTVPSRSPRCNAIRNEIAQLNQSIMTPYAERKSGLETELLKLHQSQTDDRPRPARQCSWCNKMDARWGVATAPAKIVQQPGSSFVL